MPNPQSPSPAPQPRPTAAADPLGIGDVGADPLGGGLGDAAMNAPLGTAGQQGYSPTLQSNRPKAKPKTNWKIIAIIGGSVVGVFALLGVAGVVVSVVMGTSGGDDTSTQVADTTNAAYSASPSSTADSDAAASDSGSYEEWTPDPKLVAELQDEVEFDLPNGRWAIRLPKGFEPSRRGPHSVFESSPFGNPTTFETNVLVDHGAHVFQVRCPQQPGPFQYGDVRVSTLHEWMNAIKKSVHKKVRGKWKFSTFNGRGYIEGLGYSTIYDNDLFVSVYITHATVEQERAVVSTLRLVRRGDASSQ